MEDRRYGYCRRRQAAQGPGEYLVLPGLPTCLPDERAGDALEDVELRQDLHRALARLGSKHREVIAGWLRTSNLPARDRMAASRALRRLRVLAA